MKRRLAAQSMRPGVSTSTPSVVFWKIVIDIMEKGDILFTLDFGFDRILEGTLIVAG